MQANFLTLSVSFSTFAGFIEGFQQIIPKITRPLSGSLPASSKTY
jgi:hypothetical protein